MTDRFEGRPWRKSAPIETRRLVLRDFTFDDVARTALYAGDPAVARMMAPVPLPFTEAHASAFIGDVLASNALGGGLGLAVARKREPDALIGTVTFAGEGAAVEIGWWFGRAFWGKGFATEAVMALIDVAFQAPHLETIVAGAFADNPASLRVHEKLGFRIIGHSRRTSAARGCAVDHIDMALTRADWQARQSSASEGTSGA
ncbi:GNAT family N-acetyltransferase [Phreatobacter aquaticus]|uniref:GNAT family N-acetyltransferase n=1 Tax=Phreatobacter aquaticus TaxID=2570229 RepID=A0A4D7QHA5_9HYPH|nr:GNAT family protein [Phreatobacter aquaticus]QCK85219.1 GNAT family N-acetyltransferase [Phreatobacter aquaticus]